MGSESQKAAAAGEGEMVALGRMDSLKTADLLTEAGRHAGAGMAWPEAPKPVFSLADRPHNRQDAVKLTASLAKLCEEDASLLVEHNDDTHQQLPRGQGDRQPKLAGDPPKSRFNVAYDAARLPPASTAPNR